MEVITGGWWRALLWCRENHFQVNFSKMREVVVEYQCVREPVKPVTVQGSDVEMVQC